MNRQSMSLRMFLEGVVIVGSILLAFSVDAWWGERQEAEVESRFLEALESDMAWNRTELERLLEVDSPRREGSNWFWSTSPEELASLSNDSAIVVLRALQGFDTFEPRDASLRTYDLGVLDDAPLRELLGEWLRKAENAAENRSQLVEADRALSLSRGQPALDWFERDRERTGEYLAELRRDSEYLLRLRYQRTRIENTGVKLGTLLVTTEGILEVLATLGAS